MFSILRKIRKIERQSYPEFMLYLQDCCSTEDVADYCECSVEELIIVVSARAYFLATPTEIVDLAGKVGLKFMRQVVAALAPLKGKVLTVDCRKATNRYLHLLAKKGKIEIVSESSWMWENERILHMEIQIQ